MWFKLIVPWAMGAAKVDDRRFFALTVIFHHLLVATIVVNTKSIETYFIMFCPCSSRTVYFFKRGAGQQKKHQTHEVPSTWSQPKHHWDLKLWHSFCFAQRYFPSRLGWKCFHCSKRINLKRRPWSSSAWMPVHTGCFANGRSRVRSVGN